MLEKKKINKKLNKWIKSAQRNSQRVKCWLMKLRLCPDLLGVPGSLRETKNAERCRWGFHDEENAACPGCLLYERGTEIWYLTWSHWTFQGFFQSRKCFKPCFSLADRRADWMFQALLKRPILGWLRGWRLLYSYRHWEYLNHSGFPYFERKTR